MPHTPSKLKKTNQVVCCIFGDGAINRGPFLEGLNWTGVFDLPILFVCEDNGFAATTRTKTMTSSDGPAARAESLGIPATQIDGNDVMAVDEVAGELIDGIRNGSGPRFLLAKTYRLTGHTAADPAAYRDSSEVESKWQGDPIKRCLDTILETGIEDDVPEYEAQKAVTEIRQAYEIAKAAPWPHIDEAFTDIQDMDHDTTQEDMRTSRADYTVEIPAKMAKWRKSVDTRLASNESPINMARLMHEISETLPDDGLHIADGGFAAHWGGLIFDTKKPGRGFVPDRGFASIGYGLPGSMGAQIAGGDRPVIGVTGDGGFNMVVGELETRQTHRFGPDRCHRQ